MGDALAEDAAVPGGFAGIVVDLFAEGQILPALQQVKTCCPVGIDKLIVGQRRPSPLWCVHVSGMFGSSTGQCDACKAATLMRLCY